MALTPKQEKFCMVYIETGNASEAYRQAYDCKNMKPESVNRKAKDLVDKVNIAARIEELREGLAKRHEVTVDKLIGKLESAYKLAMETIKPGQAVAAVMGQAKLLGLDKQIIDHTSSDGSMTPVVATMSPIEAAQAYQKLMDGK